MGDERRLRAAVIGVGAMGRQHARVYAHGFRESAHAGRLGVRLVAVCDLNSELAAQIGARVDVAAYAHPVSMLECESPDIVSVCVPTRGHFRAAFLALSHGCHVLVEKPVVATLLEADELSAASDLFQRTVAVGHVERYNPAAIEVKQLLNADSIGQVRQVLARRLGPNPDRVRDVGVVVDLAVHDLDLMRWLLGADGCVLAANLQHRLHGPTLEDGADALLDFGGVAGTLNVSWLTDAKVRDLTVVGESGTIVADLYHKRVAIWRGFDCEERRVDGCEPLLLELEAFVQAVRGDAEAQVVSIADGKQALALALDILKEGSKKGARR